MKILKCMVVDDEPLAVSLLETFIKRTPGLILLESFTDSVLALSRIKEEKPDLVFMDIQMPDLNGIELSKMLPPETRVIFTTAFREYALEGYSVSALDYLTKPISYQKFLEAAQKARIWFELKNAAEEPSDPPAKTGRYFFINGDKKILQKVYFSDITYIEGMKDYVLIHLTSSEEPLVTHGPLKILESVLPKGSFMRVHRSYIVALDKIDSVQPGMNIMIGKTLIHVSNVYESPFLRYLKGRSL